MELYVCNEHTDYEEHRHPVPRIGNGELAKVGHTAFEFDLPENCPFRITPAVGVVKPGEVKNELKFFIFLNLKMFLNFYRKLKSHLNSKRK